MNDAIVKLKVSFVKYTAVITIAEKDCPWVAARAAQAMNCQVKVRATSAANGEFINVQRIATSSGFMKRICIESAQILRSHFFLKLSVVD
jgi:hypothetical protein